MTFLMLDRLFGVDSLMYGGWNSTGDGHQDDVERPRTGIFKITAIIAQFTCRSIHASAFLTRSIFKS
jgi:hypothetical protein